MAAGGRGKPRRAPGTPVVMLKARVSEDTRVLANAAADALGVTIARYIELLIAADASTGCDRSLLSRGTDAAMQHQEYRRTAA